MYLADVSGRRIWQTCLADMKEDEMNESFPQCGAFMAVRLAENTDRNGLHMEYRDPDGTVFARIAKVYKKKGLFGLFNAG